MTDTPRIPGAKTRGRPFPPGNPGKPKGTRSRVTRAMEALLEGEGEALTRKAVELALAGDGLALTAVHGPPAARPARAAGERRSSASGQPQGCGRRQRGAARSRGRRARSRRARRASLADCSSCTLRPSRCTSSRPGWRPWKRDRNDHDPGPPHRAAGARPDAPAARAMLRHGARSHRGRARDRAAQSRVRRAPAQDAVRDDARRPQGSRPMTRALHRRLDRLSGRISAGRMISSASRTSMWTTPT